MPLESHPSLTKEEQWAEAANILRWQVSNTHQIENLTNELKHYTCVTIKVNATYAATESDVIHAKVGPNLYARIPDTIAIWQENTTKNTKFKYSRTKY